MLDDPMNEEIAAVSKQPSVSVEIELRVMAFGRSEVVLKPSKPGVEESEGERVSGFPFVIPLETSVVGTQYETPLR